MPNFRKTKLRLLKENPFCYWCGVRVIDYVTKDGENMPDWGATIDHFVSKPFRNKHREVKKVLSCCKCNRIRSYKDLELLKNKLMTQPKEQPKWEITDWVEIFDRKFGNWECEQGLHFDSQMIYTDIINFIKTLLAEQRKERVEEWLNDCEWVK